MSFVSISMSLGAYVQSSVELPENVDWSDVSEWYVKWDKLNIKVGNEWHELNLESDSSDAIDWKRPSHTTIYKGEDSYDEILEEKG